MSKFQIWYAAHEIEIDENFDFVKEYETDLPHHDIIGKEMCDSWNGMNMEQYFDGILKDKIKSAKMTFRKKDGESIAVITVEGVPNFRFTEKVRNAINDQVGAQLCDGWGECFFGPIRTMTAPDGRKFYVE